MGYVVIAIGSPLIFLPSFHLSAAFPLNSGLVLSLITGSFDASSLPMVAYREIYYASQGWLNHRKWFWGYAFLGFGVVLEQIFVAPEEVYVRENTDGAPTKNVMPGVPTESTGLLADEQVHYATIIAEYPSMDTGITRTGTFHGEDTDDTYTLKEFRSSDPLTGKLFGRSVRFQIASSWFWLLTVFLCIYMLRTNLYIQTANSQLLYYTSDAALADTLTRAFTYLLPLGGLIAIPFVGILLDKRSSRDAMITLALFGAIFGVLGMTQTATTQIISIVFLTILRPLMYTAVSDYSAK